MIVALTRLAQDDLEQIGDYIMNDSPLRAVSFVAEIQESCMSLAGAPLASPIVPRLARRAIRRKVHGNYLIFYRVHETTIEVLRILHSARNYDRLLRYKP